jgi:hypothetical protein
MVPPAMDENEHQGRGANNASVSAGAWTADDGQLEPAITGKTVGPVDRAFHPRLPPSECPVGGINEKRKALSARPNGQVRTSPTAVRTTWHYYQCQPGKTVLELLARDCREAGRREPAPADRQHNAKRKQGNLSLAIRLFVLRDYQHGMRKRRRRSTN